MSEQERPSGRPQKPQDFSLPSLGEELDSDGRPTGRSGARKTASRPFDPTQYVQGRPAGVQADDSRSTRRGPREDIDLEDLPPPSYQPQNTPQPEVSKQPEAFDRVYSRSESRLDADATEAESAYTFVPANRVQSVPDPIPEPEHKSTRRMAKILNLVGAATSIALVLGLGFWGYRLAVRDVSGIPIVKALEGPMRIQPEDPGGELATYQGLAVNAVQAAGEAEATADRLVLAPSPVEIREGDGVLSAPIISLKGTEKSSEQTPETPKKLEAVVANAPQAFDTPSVPEVDEIEEAVAEEISIETPKQEIAIKAPAALDVVAASEQVLLDDNEDQALATELSGDDLQPDAIAISVPGVSKSPRPLDRPADFSDRVLEQRIIASQTSAVSSTQVGEDGELQGLSAVEIAPENLPAGTNLAQLGAYPSAEIARAEWDKKAAKFEDFMSGKIRVIQQAESGGRAFYRLRVHGFDTINEARQFCAALQAEGAECISVVIRK
ncbi:SPOR domain-containing protein [Falsihalocynthiibacter sp. BN13B15]|uniref:SPOR domain-containing protein n=1 Tax=Falsihalocynthiibacter sp. BN13B15 TaxID=3240871 RepID=UPI00350F56C7